MIIVNGVPKSGGTLVVVYIRSCGITLEPGGLIAYGSSRSMTLRGGKPWNSVRTLSEVLAHTANDRVIGAHVNDKAGLHPHPVVFVYRNPRNVLISYVRWTAVSMNWQAARAQPSVHDISRRIDNAAINTITNNLRCFTGWLEKATMIVRFEDFIQRPRDVAEGLCQTLDIPMADPDAVLGDKTPWITPQYRGTWSGQLSDWSEIWDERIDAKWRAAGGRELEADYGYRL